MKILLLGSIRKRIYNCTTHRQTIIAVDSYENAPAMQVAHGFEVINMLDGEALDRIVAKHKPDFIFLRLKPFVLNVLRLRKQGITVVPSAKAANFTMNRKAIRDLASKELGLKQPTTAMQLLPNCDKESKPWECLA
jgi:phosphoribosylglycinamide formyltransferase 2